MLDARHIRTDDHAHDEPDDPLQEAVKEGRVFGDMHEAPTYWASVSASGVRAHPRGSCATGPPAGVNSTVKGDWPPVGITSYSGGARHVPMTRPKASYSVTVTLTSTASSGPVLAMTPETV